METEELTELLDDDLEMWAQGGTRILPKSQLERPQQPSYPPVAYATAPSVPPPPAPTTSHAPVLAAVIGMAAVFFLASVGGGIFYAMHRASTTASTASTTETTVTTVATSEPEHVTLSTTSAAPTVVIAPTATITATQKTAAITAPPPAVVRYGTLQTFAAGNGKPVLVDGKQVGVGGSHIKAVCGKHSVVVGTGKARTYDIPCAGAPLTVGTPD